MAAISCSITDLSAACGVHLKALTDYIPPGRQTARGTLAGPPRQARLTTPRNIDNQRRDRCYIAGDELGGADLRVFHSNQIV